MDGLCPISPVEKEKDKVYINYKFINGWALSYKSSRKRKR